MARRGNAFARDAVVERSRRSERLGLGAWRVRWRMGFIVGEIALKNASNHTLFINDDDCVC